MLRRAGLAIAAAAPVAVLKAPGIRYRRGVGQRGRREDGGRPDVQELVLDRVS
jgi:hypothetical protein